MKALKPSLLREKRWPLGSGNKVSMVSGELGGLVGQEATGSDHRSWLLEAWPKGCAFEVSVKEARMWYEGRGHQDRRPPA